MRHSKASSFPTSMPKHLTRRQFVLGAGQLAAAGGVVSAIPAPAWAALSRNGLAQGDYPDAYDLTIGAVQTTIDGRTANALGINGSVPGPLVRLKEGRRIRLNVSNALDEDTSLHWHGLLLPSNMDGVPGISFPGIAPGDTYHYEFDVIQNGTYWYHSHSGLQEQEGVYAPLVIDPAGDDPVEFDREFVILLSDWTFEDPQRVFANLKKMDDFYSANRTTLGNLDANWERMRMAQTDIADVTGLTYTYLLNGIASLDNWTGIFEPGERVRLRIINGSAMSFFNVRLPGLAMSVVQADGQNVQPVAVDELQIGVAETFDVVVEPEDRAYTIMAEAADRSGFVRGTLAPRQGMTAEVPRLRNKPLLSMRDMGMDHGAMGGHHGHSMPAQEHNHAKGPGVANLAEMTMSRLDEPGVGLEDVEHRCLSYAGLRSLERNLDPRQPERELEIHLTGNMHRYMWSFDGVKFSAVDGPIVFRYGERLRLTLVNDTMMSHPIHLHGMFFELDNGNGEFNPRKHTVTVKPAEKLSVNITAEHAGHWAFHCHLLYHMKAGMMHSVRVEPA